jgi:UDP:flavonoid glycosyltransferase YjiC (YdhE family)
MRILFVAGSSAATVFALAPLATAARNAGHEVMMAAPEVMVPYIAGSGLPPVEITKLHHGIYMFTERDGSPVEVPRNGGREERMFSGRGFARMAADTLAPLRALAGDWRPDITVGGSLSYAAGVLARQIGVPFVRHAWDPSETTDMDAGAVEVLAPELAELGLTGLPEPELFIDICPPSLRPPEAPPAQMMRWIPGNQQRVLQPWMYTKDGQRPRICITAGSRSAAGPVRDRDMAFMRELVQSLETLNAEIIVAVPEALIDDMARLLPGNRVGWIPMDVLAPTCDLMVHHGGGVTCMTAMNAGVPQLVFPQLSHSVAPALRMSDYGASITVLPDELTSEVAVAACEKLLGDPSYRDSARRLSREIAAQPLPAEVVGVLEKLA